MKLLGWMHRKFRQGTGDTMKEFSLGQQTMDDCHLYHQMQNQGRQRRSSFMSVETTKYSSELKQKSSSSAEDEFAEYFDGFLAIGTLGNDNNTVLSEPETPTFEKLKQGGEEEEQDVTENELRLINDELERELAADEGWTDSSGRNSHVSNGRISQASTVTLSGKPLEIPETTGNNNTNNNMICCPLQEYLLGAAVEFPDKAAAAAEAVAVTKKETRTSLGELFERHKTEENSQVGFKCKRGDKNNGGGDKSSSSTASRNLMKKLLNKKKNALHASATASKNSSRATADSDSKLCKILQKFHKKVHPECLTSTEKSEKMHKTRMNQTMACNAGYYRDEHTLAEESNPKSGLNGYMVSRKSISNLTQWEDQDGNDSNGSRECWIKTDADYLVLEL